MEAFKSKINAIRDILRKDGVTGIDSITHCVAFYILRNLDIELCEKLSIPIKFAYCNFNKDDNGTILDHGKLFEKFYLPSRPMDCFVGILANKFKFKAIKQFGIKTSRYLESIFNIFAGIDPNTLNCNCDIVGTIYEIHLATGTSGTGMRDLGQYFTHRKVIKFMIELCAPKVVNGHIETILDPSMGTGGFLTMATKYLNEHNPGINWTAEQSNIIGFDISDSVQSLAYINLLLENGEIFENIVSQDTLHNDLIANNVHIDKVDNILANVPFGLKNIIHADCAKRIVDLKIRGTKAEPLFLQLIMLSLKENGRCAVIVPDGFLSNDAKLHTETRKYLIENMNLKKIVALDDDEFFRNTCVKSSILYFVNNGTTQEVEFSKIKLAAGEILEESLKKVKKADLVAKRYTLFLNKYLDNQVVKLAGVEYKKLGDFLNNCNFNVVDEFPDGNFNYYTCSPSIKMTNNFSLDGEYLIIGSRGTISNAIHYTNGKFGLGNNMFVYQSVIPNICLKYIYYFLKLNKTHIDSITSRTVIPMITKKSLLDIEIPIPPLAIQEKIVDILDNTYSIINTNKEQIARYESQKQALIWANTINQPIKKLKDYIKFIKPKKYLSQTEHVINGSYNLYTSSILEIYKTNETTINNPSIIFNSTNGKGKAVVHYDIDFSVSMDTIIINCININTKYIFYYLSKNINIIESGFRGSNHKHLSSGYIEELEIPIPSPEIQFSIVQQCEQIDSIITTLSKDNERLESVNLIQCILESLNTQPTNSTQPEIDDTTHIEPTLDAILESTQEPNPIEKKLVIKKSINKKSSK